MKTTLELDAINRQLEPLSPQEIVRWAYETFGTGLAMLSSMQRTASTLTHILYTLNLTDVDILFVDTQYHFPETLELRDRLIETYGVRIKTLTPDRTPEEQFRDYGRELYLRDGDYQICCRLRKEEPYLQAARSYEAILSGLMRSEEGARKNTPIVAPDPRVGVYKIHPLANWNHSRVDEYNRKHNVPVHPLHDCDYPSIGCRTCTTPVKPGEDERAGRWRHIWEANPEQGQKLYCGINFGDRNTENKKDKNP